jgi:hypothetical protein
LAPLPGESGSGRGLFDGGFGGGKSKILRAHPQNVHNDRWRLELLRPMNPTIELLEKYQIITPEAVNDYVYGLQTTQWNDFQDELKETFRLDSELIDPEQDLGLFSFLASSSIRGESGCRTERCRLAKVNMIGRYAGLFCDRVVIPVHLHSADPDGLTYFQRRGFAVSLISLLELRPLIEAKIIRLVPGLDFCPQCHPERLQPDQEILNASEKLMNRHYSKFFITKVRMKSGEDKLVLKGPEEFIEHGEIVKAPPYPFPIKGLRYGTS